MKKAGIFGILLLTSVSVVRAQVADNLASKPAKKYRTNRKKQLYALWGWNRDAYTHSTLSIKGDDYDLVLHEIKAKDKPTAVTYHNYLQPDRMTIPQTNFRIGYFIKDDWALTLGVDHMKYVMVQNQTVQMNGVITRPGNYTGTYNGPMVLTEDFFTFEHTDGLNLLNVGAEKYLTFIQSKDNNFIISGLVGAEVGVMLPKTNAKLMDYKRNDRFHLSGFGLDAKAGIEATFFRHLVLKFEAKGGYINMPNIILHEEGVNGKGKQDFFFVQANGMIGLKFSFGKN